MFTEDECELYGLNKVGPAHAVAATAPTLYDLIRKELDHAYGKHGRRPWGRHEFYGIIKEEFDEMWADIKADAPQEQLLKEIVQVAAMCFRYFETGDAYRGPHPAVEPRK